MNKFNRNTYLNKLIDRKDNGLIKVVTGLRRSGKSYLLNEIFYSYLLNNGVLSNNIIKFSFENDDDIDLLDKYFKNEKTKIKIKNTYVINSKKFRNFIKEKTSNQNERYYLLLDEIQYLDEFTSTLNTFLSYKNLDIYVTGSNSHLLSKDIITEFRGRGDVIHIYPLSFKEIYEVNKDVDRTTLLNEYMIYGGLPLTYSYNKKEDKAKYLKDLFELTYFKDIIDRYAIERKDVLDSLSSFLAFSIGSLTNPKKLSDTFISKGEKGISINTISSYLTYLEDSYLINKSKRYDIKGKEYLSTPYKYFYSDLGLRNAMLNFINQDYDHLLENLIYNELLYRGFNLDIGVSQIAEKGIRKYLEVDFIANKFNNKYYIQVALSILDSKKKEQEIRSLKTINDSFKKVLITFDNIPFYRDENGFLIINVFDFLLDENSLDY